MNRNYCVLINGEFALLTGEVAFMMVVGQIYRAVFVFEALTITLWSDRFVAKRNNFSSVLLSL